MRERTPDEKREVASDGSHGGVSKAEELGWKFNLKCSRLIQSCYT